MNVMLFWNCGNWRLYDIDAVKYYAIKYLEELENNNNKGKVRLEY